MGHVRSKTRSLGQIVEKHSVFSRSHIFSPIVIKLGQSVFLNEIGKSLKMGHVRSNWVTRSNLTKTLCMLKRPDFQFNPDENCSECLP